MSTFSGQEESWPSVSGHGVSFTDLVHLISWTPTLTHSIHYGDFGSLLTYMIKKL